MAEENNEKFWESDEFKSKLKGMSGEKKMSKKENAFEPSPEEIEQRRALEELARLQPDAAYKKISEQSQARDVKLPAPTDLVTAEGGPRSLSEAFESMEDLTDMQFATKKLFPEHLGSTINNAVMIARVSPDMFLAMLGLMSVNEIMLSDPMKSIDVNGIYTKNYVLLSTGLEGMGRIDLIELAGAARDEKNKRLAGFGGAGGLLGG